MHQKVPVFNHLRTLFNTIYFPSEVINEFAKGEAKESHRSDIIKRLGPFQGFYRHCNNFDSFVLATVLGKKNIDKGEAEAYAQFRRVSANFILSDDKRFTVAVKELDSSVLVYTTLHVISWLDLAGLIGSWKETLRTVHSIRPFNSCELREAYCDIAKKLGVSVSRKSLSVKCSLKKIL